MGKIYYCAPASAPTPPAPGVPVLYVLGDSIMAGVGASVPAVTGVMALVTPRWQASSAGASVVNDSAAGRRLYYVAGDPTLRATLTAAMVTAGATAVWLELSTNDFGSGLITLTDFRTMYDATLDAIHAALPTARIYAQTAILRGLTTNALGDHLSDFRTQITNSVATRTAFTTLIDGTTIVTGPAGNVTYWHDSTHPNDAGHAQFAAVMESTLGV